MTIKRRRSPIWKVSSEKFREIVTESKTITEILKRFGLTNKGGNYQTLKKRIEEEGIDISHINLGHGHNKGRILPKIKIPLCEILIQDSSYSRQSLKIRLLQEGLLENKCKICGLDAQWNGQPLSLVLDHINGIYNDNRIENLRLLCPNCNSQTPTFAGKKLKIKRTQVFCIICTEPLGRHYKTGVCKKCSYKQPRLERRKVERPSKDELEKMVWKKPTTEIAQAFGVSDKAIEKWCKSYGIEKPPRGHWARKKSIKASRKS